MKRKFSPEDTVKIAQWCKRIHYQRSRLVFVKSMVDVDDPEALTGQPRVVRGAEYTPAKLVQSVRIAAGQVPLHSELSKDYFAARKRSFNYRSALRQFRDRCGDLPVNQYDPDHCWDFRKWLDEEALDEKKGQKLAGQTKLHKLGAVRSLFDFAVEERHRDDNPMQNVKTFSKTENIKKRRRLYTPQELKALFVEGQREAEWQQWLPILGLYAGMRLREALQLRPHDVSNDFGVWHIIIRPGPGQSVKGGRARVVPVHKELERIGFVALAKRAQKDGREWLFRDVPLVEKPGPEFNAPDVAAIMVPSQNAATQWFGRYSDECGVTDPSVDYHALRGAFATYGSQQGRDLSLRMEIVGHSKGSNVHGRYIYSGAPLRKLKAEIDAIRYPIRILV
jgi:integrase